jgi:hypothetical protein
MKKYLFSCLAILLFVGATYKKVASLPKELQEISGLAFIDDSTIVAHNDSGDSAKIYLISTSAKLLKTVKLSGAKNVDYEDITTDGKGNLFLADIGNNNNNRKDLVVYKFSSSGIRSKNSVSCSKINFSYPEQKAYPPAKNQFYYDAECITYYKDSLYIFTKCRTEPFDGICKVYSLPTKAGTYKAKLRYQLKIGKRDWYRDAVTSGEFHGDLLYLITYNRIIKYKVEKRKAIFQKQYGLGISQKEALAVNKKGLIYIADEKHKLLGGGNLHTLKWE